MNPVESFIGIVTALFILMIGLSLLFYPLNTVLPDEFLWLIPDFLINISIVDFFFSVEFQQEIFLLIPLVFIIGGFAYALS